MVTYATLDKYFCTDKNKWIGVLTREPPKPKRKKEPFRKMPKVGDKICRGRNGGCSPQTVYDVCLVSQKIWAEYDGTKQNYYPQGQLLEDITILESNQGENTMTTKLYEVDEAKTTKTFATKLATNSEGMWVMEEKGTGRVFTANKEHCEEVIPHTIDIQFLGTSYTVYSYFAPKGKFSKDEMYFLEAPSGLAVVRVKAVNTKKKSATKDFTPISKVNTTPVDNT